MSELTQVEALVKELALPEGGQVTVLRGTHVGIEIPNKPLPNKPPCNPKLFCIPADEFLTVGNDPGFYLWLVDIRCSYSSSIMEFYQDYLLNKTPVGKELL